MDLVHVVRHKVLVERRTQRAVARELGLGRVMVWKDVEQAVLARKSEARPRPGLGRGRRTGAGGLGQVGAVDGRQAAGTATRLHELLRTEGHRVGVTVVKEAVAEWKRQGREVFVPLTYRPRDLAEVDLFEVLVDVGGDPPEGVVLPDAPDVVGPRLRVDLRAPGSNQLSRRARPRVCAR
jgi:hypothetical protein